MHWAIGILGWLYGVLAIASTFIAAGMVRLWLDRIKETDIRKPDLYRRVLVFAGLHGAGGSIFWTIKAWDAVLNHRLNTGSFAALTVLATLLYAAGKIGLVYVSAMNSKPTVWRVFVFVAVAWSFVVWWGVAGAVL